MGSLCVLGVRVVATNSTLANDLFLAVNVVSPVVPAAERTFRFVYMHRVGQQSVWHCWVPRALLWRKYQSFVVFGVPTVLGRQWMGSAGPLPLSRKDSAVRVPSHSSPDPGAIPMASGPLPQRQQCPGGQDVTVILSRARRSAEPEVISNLWRKSYIALRSKRWLGYNWLVYKLKG